MVNAHRVHHFPGMTVMNKTFINMMIGKHESLRIKLFCLFCEDGSVKTWMSKSHRVVNSFILRILL